MCCKQRPRLVKFSVKVEGNEERVLSRVLVDCY